MSSTKKYNPKANLPAVYIPCWLIQVPDSQLSLGAKMLYGRLAQWCNAKGQVHRSTKQLAQELGLTKSPMDRYLKELRDVKLIGTFQATKGGVNHFEFYEHRWMLEPINENLYYPDPTPTEVLPHTQIGATPTPKQVSLNINNKKKNNYNNNYQKKDSEPSKNPSLKDMLEDNPHNIPEEMIEDWIENRKTQKTPITRTAWKSINKTMATLWETKKVTPQSAFELMVSSGWRSLQVKYFENTPTKKSNGSQGYDHESIAWAKGIEKDIF